MSDESDIRLAVSAIASELNIEVDELPPAIEDIVRKYGESRYSKGASELVLFLLKLSRGNKEEC